MRAIAALLAVLILPITSTQENSDAARRKALDTILDMYVRDGFVYYRALKADRRRLDGYLSQIASASIENDPRDAQIAFWLNAYNALVLETIVEHYPIPQRSSEYPQHSIRQIPGAFERTTHRVAGRALTLDQIEQTILSSVSRPSPLFRRRTRRRRRRTAPQRSVRARASRGAACGSGLRMREPAAVCAS